MGVDTVFISYSHDSPEHSTRVLMLSETLRALGVDAEIDQYVRSPPQGWPRWCEERLRPENSKYVLTICTPTYRNRVEKRATADEGRGVYWEGSVIYQYIYEDKANERFIPVLLGNVVDDIIPFCLNVYNHYIIKEFDLNDGGFQALYRALTGQPSVVKGVLGPKVHLPPKWSDGPVVSAPLPERPVVSGLSCDSPKGSPPAAASWLSKLLKIEFEGGGVSDLRTSTEPDTDYKKLSSGSIFIGPDGRRRRKP